MPFSKAFITQISAFEGKFSNNLLLYHFPVDIQFQRSPLTFHLSPFISRPCLPAGRLHSPKCIHCNLHKINEIKYLSTSIYFIFFRIKTRNFAYIQAEVI